MATFAFPRQRSGARECLSDYVRPLAEGGGDSVALFVTPRRWVCGSGRKLSRARGATSCAMPSRRWLETMKPRQGDAATRRSRGVGASRPAGDDNALTTLSRLDTGASGTALATPCPDLSAQAPLFDLLKPEHIGVRLTEGFMMTRGQGLSHRRPSSAGALFRRVTRRNKVSRRVG